MKTEPRTEIKDNNKIEKNLEEPLDPVIYEVMKNADTGKKLIP